MPQRDLLLPWRTALDNAGLALELPGSAAPRRGGARCRLFERFGLEGFARARPDELSGGMRQRVSFARTLLAEKPILLLDEPFGSLDSITRAELQEWLAGALAEEPRTTLLVTHDVEEALFLCDRVLILSPRPGTVRAELARRARSRNAAAGTGHLAGVRGAEGAGAGGARVKWAAFARGRRRACAGGPAGDSAAGSCSPRWARSRTTSCRRRARSPARSGETGTCSRPTPGSRPARCCSASRSRSRPASRSRSSCTSPPSCDALLYPLVVASQAVPVVVIAPILVIWFGFGITPKLIVIALICFFPVVVNTLDGLEGGRPRAGQDDAHARRLAGRPAAPAGAALRRCRSCSRAPRWRSR